MTVEELVILLLDQPLDNKVFDTHGNELTGIAEPFMGMGINETYLESKK
jgi:hypothetical protein